MSTTTAAERLDAASEIVALRQAIDALAALEDARLGDAPAVVALAEERARLDSVLCRQAAAFQRAGTWSVAGATTSAAWVATETRVPVRVAQRAVRLGRAVRGLDHVEPAFAAGAISVDHVDALVQARTRSRATAAAFGRAEAVLVEWARTLPFDRFRRRLDEWLLWADTDGAEDHAAEQRSRRRLHLSQSFENVWFADAVLDPVGGEIVHEALRNIDRELFRADRATATAALGREPTADELATITRTPAQRRADALVEMARRAMTVPAGGSPPRPLFTVLVGEESFRRMCELASGTVVTPGSLAWWLDDAVIERIVFDGPDRVLSVGRHRSFRGALRRAVEVVHRTCAHPYCSEPAHRCEVDHIDPWALGGATAQANGRLLCGSHNRQRPNSRRPKGRQRAGGSSAGRHPPDGGEPG
jgi:hypothetical protein